MIDWNIYKKAVSELSKSKLSESYKGLVKEADLAWKSNLRAVKLIDLRNDGVKGERELVILQKALIKWIKKLENLSDASKEISKWASKSVYEGKSIVESEKDSQGNGDNTEGLGNTGEDDAKIQ